MVNLIQPITVQQAYDGITHARWWASWNWWWRIVDNDDGDESPSPEPRTDSRSALPREIRAWRRLRIVKRDESFSLIFSPRTRIYRVGVEVGGAPGGPRGRGGALGGQARLPPSWTGCGPHGLHLWRGFFIIFYKMLHGVSGHSENICFLHIKQHHGNSAENSVSPG